MPATARRLLVVANRACPCPEVLETVKKRAAGVSVTASVGDSDPLVAIAILLEERVV